MTSPRGGVKWPRSHVAAINAAATFCGSLTRDARVTEIAQAAGISPLYLSQIERATRTGSVATLAALAKALDVQLDDLIAV